MSTTGGTRYKVLYDYDATIPDELTIRAGQIVYVTEQLDKGWVRGYIGDQVGMFPAAYAEPDTSNVGPPTAPLPAAPASSTLGPAPTPSTGGAETAVVIEEFPAKDSSQLALAKDQIIVVLRKYPTGWANGEYQGKTGMFPLKNVRIVDVNEAAALRAASASSSVSTGAGAKKVANKEKRMSRIRSNTLSSITKVRISRNTFVALLHRLSTAPIASNSDLIEFFRLNVEVLRLSRAEYTKIPLLHPMGRYSSA